MYTKIIIYILMIIIVQHFAIELSKAVTKFQTTEKEWL